MRKAIVALTASAALAFPLGGALAAPPDNRPPADRGHGHGHGQSQSQTQNQEQNQSQSQCIIVLGLLQPAEC